MPFHMLHCYVAHAHASLLPGGKSVILTAITYAFGAKASVSVRRFVSTESRISFVLTRCRLTTQQARGTSQNSFIRTGQNSCEVVLSLRNKGDEAYRPEVYGKTIWITRRTSVDGSSSYRIADQNKKTVASNKKELAAICDHFQIQVENPVNVSHYQNALCRDWRFS